MTLTNRDVARILDELADLHELHADDDGMFRVRALRAGARAVERLLEPAIELVRAKRLTRQRGLGEGIHRRIQELADTGKLVELEEARRDWAALAEIARVDGIGAATTRRLHRELAIRSLDELEAAAAAGRLASLSGYGPKRIEALLRSIERARAPTGKLPRVLAEKLGQPILEAVRQAKGVTNVVFCGSIRRRRALIGDVDLLVGTDDQEALAEAVSALSSVEHLVSRGGRTSAILYTGQQIDCFLCIPEEWGHALHHWTGSRDHNIALRLWAAQHGGWKITEHGIYHDHGAGARVPLSLDESYVYGVVGLPVIPLPMREGRGEVQVAAEGRLPRLIVPGDLRGDLHVHTTASDGKAGLAEMAAAAAALGREYLAITDHAPGRPGARGHDPDSLRAQIRAIRELNDRTGGKPRVLCGAEVEIDASGEIAFDPRLLGQLDWVLGAAHEGLDLPPEAQTRRLVRAVESGLIDCLAHPLGRILAVRDPLAYDLHELVAACARTDVALELNCRSDRLDLDDDAAFIARERKVWLAAGTDAHDEAQLAGLTDLDMAQRGWVEPDHVLNTRPVVDLLDLVALRRREAGW
jgi:DNA polymerase (family 10)